MRPQRSSSSFSSKIFRKNVLYFSPSREKILTAPRLLFHFLLFHIRRQKNIPHSFANCGKSAAHFQPCLINSIFFFDADSGAGAPPPARTTTGTRRRRKTSTTPKRTWGRPTSRTEGDSIWKLRKTSFRTNNYFSKSRSTVLSSALSGQTIAVLNPALASSSSSNTTPATSSVVQVCNNISHLFWFPAINKLNCWNFSECPDCGGFAEP